MTNTESLGTIEATNPVLTVAPPKQYNPNLVPIGHGFGFIVLMEEIEDW